MMLNKITNYEKEMIDFYRKSYTGEFREDLNSFCSTDHFLRNWAREKCWLYRMFGNELILSRPASYATPYSKIYNELEKAYCDDDHGILYKFIKHFCDKLLFYFYGRTDSWEPLCKRDYCRYQPSIYGGEDTLCTEHFELYEALRQLVTLTALAKTTYQYRTINKVVMPKTGRTITLVKDQTKVIRVIQSLVEELELDKQMFEEFRIRLSKFFNQSKLEGELCISIHPLDYITMSENSFNWKSCMNWHENGCYRRGTVEMLNSDCVVVAYLKSTKKPFEFGDGYSWNNKMWRMLFVVNEEAIVGIKSYPYSHDQITQDVIAWLRDLVCANGHPKYTNKDKAYSLAYMDDDRWKIEFETNAMYNDFSCTKNGEHWALFAENIENDLVNYSGYSECVWCGDDEYANQEDSNLFACSQEDLVCKNCSVYIGYCGDCGDRIRVNDVRTYTGGVFGSYTYCEHCYNEHVRTCPVTGTVGVDTEVGHNDMIWLSVVDDADSNYNYKWILVKDRCWNTHPTEWANLFGDQIPVEWRGPWGGINRNKRKVALSLIPKTSIELLGIELF